MSKPIDKEYLIDNMKTFKSVILDPAYIIQRQVLPQPTADNLDVVYQYVGSDSTNYTIGGFYQVQQVAGSDPATYHWVEITTRTSIDDVTIKENANKEIYVPKATSSSLGVISAGDGTEVDANGELTVVARLEEISALPTATAALEGKCYILVATQTGYNKGTTYQCQSDGEDPATYSWIPISGGSFNEDDFDVDETTGEVSLDPSRKIFNGTLDEYEALSATEQAKYGYVASPDDVSEDIADEITDGDMRPVTSNAVYDGLYHEKRAISYVGIGTYYTEVTGLYSRSSHKTNVYMVTARNGEAHLMFCGTSDYSSDRGLPVIPVIKTLYAGTSKLKFYWDSDEKTVAISSGQFNATYIQQISGEIAELTFSAVSTTNPLTNPTEITVS